MAQSSYGQDKDFAYLWTVTLALEIWHSVKAMTHRLVMGNIMCEIWSQSKLAVKRYNPETEKQTVIQIYSPNSVF